MQEPSDFLNPIASDTVGQKACVADAVEAGWQDVDQEAADKLIRGKVHDLHSVPALDPIVFPAESHGARSGADQTGVRDCDPMGVAAQVPDDLLWASEGPFRIDDPGCLVEPIDHRGEGGPLHEVGRGADEAQ